MTSGIGKNTRVLLNGYDVSTFLKSVKTKMAAKAHDSTTFRKNSECYIGGLLSGSINASGLLDTLTELAGGSVEGIHDVFRLALGGAADSVWEAFWFDDAVGSIGVGMRTKNTSYDVNDVIGDLVSCSADGTASNQWDALVSLLALAAQTNAGNGTAVDNGAATTNGGAGYICCTGPFSGTSVQGKIQHSSDNFASDIADLVTFTTITTANASEVIEVAAGATVKRYLRALWTGTFTAPLHFAFGRR